MRGQLEIKFKRNVLPNRAKTKKRIVWTAFLGKFFLRSSNGSPSEVAVFTVKYTCKVLIRIEQIRTITNGE